VPRILDTRTLSHEWQNFVIRDHAALHVCLSIRPFKDGIHAARINHDMVEVTHVELSTSYASGIGQRLLSHRSIASFLAQSSIRTK
jgi:hypothetical protein